MSPLPDDEIQAIAHSARLPAETVRKIEAGVLDRAEDPALTKFKEALKKHDWTYMFSDDNRAYLAGEASMNKLVHEAKNGSDDMKRAYNEAHAKQFHRAPFAKPYTMPFREAQ